MILVDPLKLENEEGTHICDSALAQHRLATASQTNLLPTVSDIARNGLLPRHPLPHCRLSFSLALRFSNSFVVFRRRLP